MTKKLRDLQDQLRFWKNVRDTYSNDLSENKAYIERCKSSVETIGALHLLEQNQSMIWDSYWNAMHQIELVEHEIKSIVEVRALESSGVFDYDLDDLIF